MNRVTVDDFVEVVDFLELVPVRTGMASSQFVRIRASSKEKRLILTLAAAVSAEAYLPYKGEKVVLEKELCVDRRLLFPYILVAKGIKTSSDFEFEFSGTTVKLRQGRRLAVLESGEGVVGYSPFPKMKGSGIELRLDENTLALIKCAAACASADPSIPHLNCVYIRKGDKRAYTLSSNEILVQQGSLGGGFQIPMSIAFPLSLVPCLSTETKVHWHKDIVVVSSHRGRLWQPVSAPAKTKFPAEFIVKRMNRWHKDFEVVFSVPCRQFSTLAGRLSQYLTSVRRLDWALSLRGDRGEKKLRLESKLPQCRFVEHLFLEKSLSSAVDMLWPLHVLAPVFDFLGSRFPKKNMTVALGPGDRDPYILSVGPVRFAVVKLARDKKEGGKK